MSLSLKDLKKQQEDTLNKLKEKSKETESNYEVDDRYWLCKRDDTGNGQAIIRFLPGPFVDGEDSLPWVKYYAHSFKGPTGLWYIENSLTTLKQPDPVTEYNSKLWNTGDKEKQKWVSQNSKRRLNYVSNILVVKDPANPENNGKVFLFRYGVKIFEKINAVMFPNEELGEVPCNPFDFWGGKNFALIIKKVGEYPNYDSSKFLDVSPIADSDEKIEEIWKSEYSLKEIIATDKFKSYEDLKNKLENVMNLSGGSVASKTAEEISLKSSLEEDDDPPFDISDSKKSSSDSSSKNDDSDDIDFDYDDIAAKLDL